MKKSKKFIVQVHILIFLLCVLGCACFNCFNYLKTNNYIMFNSYLNYIMFNSYLQEIYETSKQEQIDKYKESDERINRLKKESAELMKKIKMEESK